MCSHNLKLTDFHCSNQTKGGWSNEGIKQDSDPTVSVSCNSTHLTSFAVLVSAEGGDEFSVSV